MKPKADYLSDQESAQIRRDYVAAGIPDVKTLPDSVYVSLELEFPLTEEGLKDALGARTAEQDALLSMLESYKIEEERCGGYLMDRDRRSLVMRRLGTVRCHIGLLIGSIQKMNRSALKTISFGEVAGIRSRLDALESRLSLERDKSQARQKLFRMALVDIACLLSGGVLPDPQFRVKAARRLKETILEIVEADGKALPQDIAEVEPEDWAILGDRLRLENAARI